MDNFDLKKYLAEGKLLKEEYNLPDSDSTTDQYVNNHWDGILKDILRAHTDLRNSKGGESIPERPSQLDIDIVLGRFDGADEFTDVDPSVYEEYFDFYDMYLVTQRDEENTKSISDEDYPKGNYDGYTKRDDLPKLSEGKLLKEEETFPVDYYYIKFGKLNQKGADRLNNIINNYGATEKFPDLIDRYSSGDKYYPSGKASMKIKPNTKSMSYKRLKLDGEDMEIGSDDIQLKKPYDISTGGKSWYPMYYLGDFDYQIYRVDADGNKTQIQFPDIK